MKGTIAGMIAGGLLSAYIAMAYSIEYLLHRLKDQELPVYIDGCQNYNGTTTMVHTIVDNTNVFFFHRITFQWVCPIGFLTVLTVGTAVSYWTGGRTDGEIDPQLISPVVHRYAVLCKLCGFLLKIPFLQILTKILLRKLWNVTC